MNSNTMTPSELFFSELKHYNPSNFKTLHRSDVILAGPEVYKAFSSVITRYFIFCEKHSELTQIDKRILYFQLKLDMIARFFASYPNSNSDDLVAFQTELRYFLNNTGDDANDDDAA